MDPSRNSADKTRKRTGLGRCRHFFWLGVVFDTVGATVLFTGVFADLLYCDLLLYLGSIIIFLSLLWWVFWYTGNIELTPEGALKRPIHVDALSQTVNHRFSFRLCHVSSTFRRQIRLGRRRRRLLRRASSLDMTVTGQVEKHLAKEDQDKDGMKSVKKRSDAEDFGREDLGPEPEAAQGSEGVCASGPDAGPRCPEAGLPGIVVEGASAHLVQPEFTPSPLDQPLPPAILTSVVPLASASQPPVTLASTSLPAVPLSSAGQPLDTLASKSQTTDLVVSESHPVVPQIHLLVPVASQSYSSVLVTSQSHSPVASQNHLLVSEASQSHPLLSVATQSHLLIPVALESNFQNFSLASQTQPQPVQASQAQTLATPVSLIQLLSAPSCETRPVDLQVTPAVQDFQVLYDTQLAPQSSALVQEVALSQSSLAQEILKKPVAQAFKTVPATGQELSQEVPDTVSSLPESLAPATQAQQSVSPENASTPASEKNSHTV